MLVPMVIDGFEAAEDAAPADEVGDLIRSIAAGDRDAFARLYDGLAPRVFGLILRVLVDRAQSEEVLQEVFLEIWQSAGRFAPKRGQGRTWILTIAHRRAIDRVRSVRASDDRDRAAGLRELATTQPGVAERVEAKVESERVTAALERLPEAQREALGLAYYGGYSQSEIAALVGAPLGTVKTRMRDGLTRLRKEMGVEA
ncbi:ECF RNA polymerase sigma factor SigK [Microbacterium sp. X-17]|uniref:ECF RNA polymerase sigma factor SigK n=1 Tax=Microbacterium sp. X-17 TaxID=3144404 RepID=UPI0031F53520